MSGARTNVLSIQTPEGISFSFTLAGPVVRFLAWSIDLACISVASLVLGALVNVVGLVSRDIASAVAVLIYFAISIGYGIAAEWSWRGQTLGKKLFRLRVMDVEGLRLQFSQVVMRNLLRFIDMLPLLYLVGGVACLLSRRLQRLGDLAANTVVVRHLRTIEPDLEQLMAGKFNSLRQFPHLVARLRQRISPAEADIALQALLRRDQFDPPARIDLFRRLAAHFKAVVDFPAEAIEGIADEQYVRNIIDVLYRPRHKAG
jgi:uncharacterized RDD family membrane protein YckC